ncbi:hypothetical protein K7432_004512 [Basidiobolus ranarum]|uniref:Uncharacterized protein n=1 Tax=Basidiobolus ranarum TaxID=34480 RepID=A0ABR2WY62_9FUNG
MSTADKRLNSKGQVDDGPIPFFGNSGGDTDLFGSLVSSQPSTQPTQPNGWQNPSYNDKASIPPRSNSTAPVTQSAVSQPFSPQYPTPQRPKTTDPSVGQGSENVSSFFDNYSATQNVTAEPSRQSQGFLNSAQNSQDASFFDNPNYGQQIQGHEVQAQSPSSYNAYQPQSYADSSTQQYEAGSKDADWYTQNGYQQNAGYQGVEGAYAQQPQYQENYTGYQQTAGHDYGAYNENYYEGYDQQLASQQDPSAAGYYSHGQEYSDPNYVDPNAEYQNQGYTEGYGYDYTQGYDYNSSAYDPAYADYYQQQGYEGQYAEGGEGYIQPVGEAVAAVDSSNSHYHQQSTYTHPTQVAESSPNYQGQEMAETQNYTDPGAFFESFPADQNQAHYEQDYSLPESSNGYLGEEAYSPLSFQDQTVPDSPAVALINPSEEPEISKQPNKGANEIQPQGQYISDFTKGSDVSNTNDTQEHSVPDDEVSIVKDNSDIFETAEDPVIKQVVHEEPKGNDKKPPVTKPLEQVDNSDPLGQTEDIDINDPSLFDTAADMLSSFVGGASYTSDKPESPKSHDDQRSSFEQSHSQSDNLDDLDDLVLGSTSSLQDTGSLEKTKELTSESPYGFDTIIRGEASPDIVSLPSDHGSDHVSIEGNSTQQTSNQKVEAKSDVISDIESIIKSPESSVEQSPPASTESISLKETDAKGDEHVKKEESVEYNSEAGNNPLGLSNLDVKSDVSFSQDKDESSKELSTGLAQPNHNAQFFDDIVSSSAEDQLKAVELPLDQDSQSNLNSHEQDSINDGVQLGNDLHQLPIETSSDVLKLPHDTQDLTVVNQESSGITNDAGDEVLTEANYQNQEANESKYPEQGEMAEPEVEIEQKPIEKDPFEFGGVVAVDESAANDAQESSQNEEMFSPNHDDVEQYHVNTDLKLENDASDAIPEHASDAQTHYHQNSYGVTEYYQNNQANNLKSEQHEETPEMNTQQASENGQHLDSNNDLAKNQSSWEEVHSYRQEYDFNERRAHKYGFNEYPSPMGRYTRLL